ncbi:NACHT domain-containing protein [Nitrosomonas halophila]|uniref:NACHT domain-containing protein n=1 Tax=Nitrosomonas halophila TaxID=44576 RepID=A0A1H3NZK1_9PROT|nr:NACHT domain-containing protein [Nitrosomonas halophila]SDY93975.1 NACHT domain-containing protein [Nitrosomonas halophila]
MSEKSSLIDVYKRYGFNLASTTENDESLVFTLKTGYFDNAEIIKLNPNASVDDLFKDLSAAGYACSVRTATTLEKAEEELFNGFFSVKTTRHRLADEYKKFASSLVRSYGEKAKYEYIKAPYHINGKEGQKTAPEEILSRIEEDRPILFLIEAAAGFGKTCTAQEISQLLVTSTGKLPLYAELSRNRQARIFRYILLDEIDRTFPLLSSKLVQTEIKNGRISVILDGFDELLRKGEDGEEFDNKEPMLETISELLTGKAKIIITTRRTILFDGDEFHQWLESHANDFSVVRIRIQEPKINDWLPYERIEPLRNSGLDLDAIANPVLLSYLRCIDDELFRQTSNNPEGIVQSYFEYMLDRERERQDLRMTIKIQEDVLRRIAEDMIAYGYTAEDRDYIIKTILEKCSKEIESARNQYSSSDKPTREEIANKLASHALFDRSSTESEKIGFVNDFSLGNYVAENIISDSSWLGDDLRFIEPAVKSYVPRTQSSREILFNGLKGSLPYIETVARIEISTDLMGNLPDDLRNDSVDDLDLSLVDIGSRKIKSFQFSDSTFKKCRFIKSGLEDVTFINCRFFDCEVVDDGSIGSIYILGGTSSPEIISQLSNLPSELSAPSAPDHERLIEKSIIKRFWPAGDPLDQKPSRPIYKPMKYLCQPMDGFNSLELYAGIERVVKAGILTEMSRSNLISLNIENINKAYDIFREAE